ncbi:OmpA family protein [Actinomadura sp. 21ATH]|uniref:OmpA family protein n=1 Tax=Actinomadura sp. 21ATH TaxID=1735444 RepID=UPI0035C017A0
MALALTSCSSSGDPKAAPSTPARPSAATPGKGGVLQSQPLLHNGAVRFDLTALDRVSNDVVVAKMTARNNSQTEASLGLIMRPVTRSVANVNSFQRNSIGGMALLDGAGARLYHPLVEPGRKCLCSRSAGFPTVPAGGTLEFHAAFPAPPAGVSKLGVLVPGVLPFTDIPVGNRPGTRIDLDDGNRGVDPVAAKKGPERILPVTAITESDVGAEEDDGTNLNVRISTDVLFAVNKADLTPAAQQTLREVAGKIQNSPGGSVKVEGHADSSGNDAINQPLSERRAQSVVEALKKLVTRSGVTYESQGFGSSKPIASNDTEEGKKKNRRVVVSFARPKPAGSGSPGQGAGAPAKGRVLKPTTGPKGTSIHVDEVRRDGNGYTTVAWTLRNEAGEQVPVNGMFDAPSADGYIDGSTSGVFLGSGGKRYRAVRDGERYAFGPKFASLGLDVNTLEKGEQIGLYTMVRLPPEVTTVTLDIPGYGKAENVAVG